MLENPERDISNKLHSLPSDDNKEKDKILYEELKESIISVKESSAAS